MSWCWSCAQPWTATCKRHVGAICRLRRLLYNNTFFNTTRHSQAQQLWSFSVECWIYFRQRNTPVSNWPGSFRLSHWYWLFISKSSTCMDQNDTAGYHRENSYTIWGNNACERRNVCCHIISGNNLLPYHSHKYLRIWHYLIPSDQKQGTEKHSYQNKCRTACIMLPKEKRQIYMAWPLLAWWALPQKLPHLSVFHSPLPHPPWCPAH